MFIAPAADIGTNQPNGPAFSRASIAWTSDLAMVASGKPRVEQGVVVERGSTNSLTRSRELNLSPWEALNNPTLTRNAVGVDGVANSATTLTDDSISFEEYLRLTNVAIVNDSAKHTVSAYFRKDSVTSRFPTLSLRLFGGTEVKAYYMLNTATGAVTKRSDASAAGVSAIVIDAGDWWRMVVTATNNTSGNVTAAIYISPAGCNVWGGAVNVASTGSIVVDQLQLELGLSYATSPIPTAGAAATRAAESLSLPATAVLGASEGTVEIDYLPRYPSGQGLHAGTAYLLGHSSSQIAIYIGATTLYAGLPGWGGGRVISFAAGQPLRMTLAWKVGDGGTFWCGGLSFTPLTFSAPAPTSGVTAGTLFLGSLDGVANHCGGEIVAVRFSSARRTQADVEAWAGKPLAIDNATTALLLPAGGDALLLRPADLLQLPSPQRPYRRVDLRPQLLGYDSAGEVYVQGRGATRRVQHELRLLLDGDERESLATFVRDQAHGIRHRFLWLDDTDGAARLVRHGDGRVGGESAGNGRLWVDLPLVEELPLPPRTLANYAAALADRAGQTPVWILKLTVNGVAYYLADDEYTLAGWNGGVTTLRWVARWGQVREGLSGDLGEIRVSDLDLELLVDPDVSPNIETLAILYPLEKSACSLYLWFRGLDATTDPPQELLRGYVRDVEIPDQTAVRIVVEDESIRLQKKIGTMVTKAAYPSADPDDVGKVIPIVFGSVGRLPALALNAGVMTTLSAAVSSSGVTTISVTDPTGLVAGKTIEINAERLYISSVAGSVLTVIRGYGGTTATTHTQGDAVFEVMGSPLAFAAADAAVDSLSKVYVRAGELDYDVTGDCTRYTGQVGSQLAGYGSMAMVTISAAQAKTIRDRIAAAQVKDQIAVSNGAHGHAATVTETVIQPDSVEIISGSIITSPNDDGYNAIDGSFATGTLTSATGHTIKWRRTRSVGLPGAPTRMRACIQLDNDAYNNVTCTLNVNGTGGSASVTAVHDRTTYKTGWMTVTTWANVIHSGTYLQTSMATGSSNPKEIWFEVEYDPSPPSAGAIVAKSGTVNSVADRLLGGLVLVDVVRTKTAAQVCDDILARCGAYAATTVTGNLPGGYAVNGAITEYREARQWLDEIAFQLRSYFRLQIGVPRLIVRPDALVSSRTIAACRAVDGRRVHGRRKASLPDVINRINLRYDRDWTKTGDEAYRQISSGSSAGSISDYGEQERPELFRFDFVTSAVMADSLRDFYLGRYATRRWLHEFEVYLDHAEVEQVDAVTLGFAGDALGEVQQVRLSPGDVGTMDIIGLVVEV